MNTYIIAGLSISRNGKEEQEKEREKKNAAVAKRKRIDDNDMFRSAHHVIFSCSFVKPKIECE